MNKRRPVRILALMTVVWLIAAGFCGCAKKGNSGKSSSGVEYPVSVGGIQLDKAPERVVVLSPSLAEIACDMGFSQALCGRAVECDNAAYAEELTKLPAVGSMMMPNLDQVTALTPDLILTGCALPDSVREILTEKKIPVAVIPPAVNWDTLKEVYVQIGKIFSGSQSGQTKGEEQHKRVEERLNAVTASVSAAGVAGDSPVSVLVITDSFGHAVTGDTLQQKLITAAGLRNAAEQSTGWTVSDEAAAQAQVIFCPSDVLDTVGKTEKFASSPAVKDGRLYSLDLPSMERQSMSMVKAAEEMARTVYPDSAASTASETTGEDTTAP